MTRSGSSAPVNVTGLPRLQIAMSANVRLWLRQSKNVG
jgi:hypothetical protein